MKYIILTAAFALASCASNGHHAAKSCHGGDQTKMEKGVKKECKSCKTKKDATKKCESCKTKKKAA